MIVIENHGSLITSTNYWQSDLARAGKLFVSPNAGVIRVLVPPQYRDMIEAARGSEYAVVSVGPWPVGELTIEKALQILWEDRTPNPYLCIVLPEACLTFPAEPLPGEAWVISVWDEKKGRPHKAVERRCHYRSVDELPCLLPWEGKS